MPNRRQMIAAWVLAALLVAATTVAPAQDKVKVIASFSILGDLVKNVGGERVEVATLVGPNGNAHVYAPSPADAKKVAAAKAVFINGLGFEGWLDRLVKASNTKAPIVVVSKGIKPHTGSADQDHGHIDPHAWQSVANAKIYVDNIRDALIAIDPAGKATYEANAAAYRAKLDALEQEVRETIAKIPADRRAVITSHDSVRLFRERLRHRIHRAARRLDRDGGIRQGRCGHHHADQEAKNRGSVPGKRDRSAPGETDRERDRCKNRRHALFRRADRPERRCAKLHRPHPSQSEAACRRTDELSGNAAIRVPDAAQRAVKRNAAPLIRDLTKGSVRNDPGSAGASP